VLKSWQLGCDVGEYGDLVTFVEKVTERFGTIDVLLNNAHKITNLRPFLEQGIDDLDINGEFRVQRGPAATQATISRSPPHPPAGCCRS